jgi:hypothetical protein
MPEDLPGDLSALEPQNLEEAARQRDERLEPLFRRWPRLSKNELAEMAHLYRERLRVAKFRGRRRSTKTP